jgi:hypothetical protein
MKDQQLNILLIAFIISIPALSYSQDYFQQEVNYRIRVELDDSIHSLRGFEEVEYINNSPHDLEYIYFHLWANGYANNRTALAKQKLEMGGKRRLFEVEAQSGFIDSLDFKVNGKAVNWSLERDHIDICRIILNEPLRSGETITITTPFYVKIPGGSSSKFGHIDQSYRISQWYPKPAVYDRYGWHPMPNLDLGEFYAEFGSFEVEITLPANYVVAATGKLITESELIWIENRVAETKVKTEYNRPARFNTPSSDQFKTIRYEQDNIHDFAWFADKNYNVLKSEVKLPGSGRRINTWIFFMDRDYALWKNALDYINNSVLRFSEWFGEYPYDNCSAASGFFSGGGGIEYPTITLMGSSSTALSLERNLAHEIGHNWFYGVLGFNEREHPWLDEGITSFADDRYMSETHPDAKLFSYLTDNEKNAKLLGIYDLQYADLSRKAYLFDARRNLDQPANLHSEEYNESNYLTSVIYKKNSVSLLHLMNYLGKEEFNEIMIGFFETWKYKHPYPKDFEGYVRSHTIKNTDWFFNDLVTTTKKLDYAIKRVNENQILVKNSGHISSPFSVSGVKDDQVLYTQWHEGFSRKQWVDIPDSQADCIFIDYERNTNELYLNNNIIRTGGLLKKVEPIQISHLGFVDNPVKTDINISPAIGWNNNNRFMLGALFYNSILPANKLEYHLAPLFAFGSSDFAGMGRVAYHWYPYERIFQEITVSVSALQFAYNNSQGDNFNRIKASLNFRLKKKDMKGYVDNYLRISAISATDLELLINDNTVAHRQFYSVQYEHKNDRTINKYNVVTNIQLSNGFAKADLEANYRVNYLYDKALDVRLFGGWFLYKAPELPSVYDFSMSGTTGLNDYTYDHLFFGRFENPAAQNVLGSQFVKNGGGFAVWSPFGQTSHWMVAVNVTTSVPFPEKEIIQVYGNAAIVEDPEPVAGFNPEVFYYEAGAKLIIMKDDIEVYFPLVMSKNIRDYSNAIHTNYLQKIRFVINLNGLNLFEVFRKQKNLF